MDICKVYDDSFKKGDKLVIFVKENCPYCKEAKDKLLKIQIPDSMVDNLPQEFVEVDIDECNNLIFEYGIRYTPTFLRMVNGKEYGRVEGYDEEGIKWILTLKPQEEVEEDEEGEFVE
jgi:thiol-disulfide isomerase/thioredoxin